MDGAHQPRMLLRARKPDQFSQFIHLGDLMTTLGGENGKVNKKRAEKIHTWLIISARSKCWDARKELNDVKISHFSYLTSTATVPLLHGPVQNDVLCCHQLHNINYKICSLLETSPPDWDVDLVLRITVVWSHFKHISLLFCLNFLCVALFDVIFTYHIHMLGAAVNKCFLLMIS